LAFRKTPPVIARALQERDYKEATPVQRAVIAAEADERDLLVSAQTGSGKTVAFGIAIAPTILEGAETFGPAAEPLALIIAPTRELALQVQRELSWLYQYAGARVVSCVGGMDPGRERRQLQDGAHIVVGTPGRLRDHLERRALKVSTLKAVVLDEADEMLDMGFREDLQFILETTPESRRTLLFSATLPKPIIALARDYQRDALRIETVGETKGHADIEYRAIRLPQNKIESAIVNLLRFLEPPSALIFCNTRQSVRHLEATLRERGFAAVSLSGELSQNERTHALQALRDGRARVCVATDVAARGIDLPNLGLVIHAELPNDAEVMQHRSGRTGRAGKKGVSILMVPPSRVRRAEEMLRRARVDFSWTNPPSAEDIRKLDMERLLQNPILTEPGTEEELSVADFLLNAKSPREIAAAFVKMYRAQLPAPEDISEIPSFRSEPAGRQERREHGKKAYDKPAHHKGARDQAPRGERPPRPGDMVDGVWFKASVGRERNADPKWLLPEICRQGEVSKKDIGAIRIYERETRFQVSAGAAEKFAMLVAERQKGGVRIFPAPDKLPFDAEDGTQRDKPKHFGKKHDGEKPKKWPPKHKSKKNKYRPPA
jgi:ATP-dependent RNA helicase DeaD